MFSGGGDGKYVQASSRCIPELKNNGWLDTVRIDSVLLQRADIKIARAEGLGDER
ncbi:MAG: hypothetical protein ACYSUI_10310 [Planctomycetota bacterium]|jgi:hypothetical protein